MDTNNIPVAQIGTYKTWRWERVNGQVQAYNLYSDPSKTPKVFKSIAEMKRFVDTGRRIF